MLPFASRLARQPKKGIFPREVVRVVTPGTIVEPGLLPGDANNYLAAIFADEARAGIAYADITTGEFAASELSIETMRAELMRLHPAEILHPEDLPLNNDLPGHSTPWPAWRFEPGRCEDAILTHFQAAALDGFGLKGQRLAIRAAGAILQYLKETQPDALKLLTSLHSYSLSEFMTSGCGHPPQPGTHRNTYAENAKVPCWARWTILSRPWANGSSINGSASRCWK